MKDQNFERIDRFVDGMMDKEESDAFRKELELNTELRNDYETYKVGQAVTGTLVYQDVSKRVKAFEEKYFSEQGEWSGKVKHEAKVFSLGKKAFARAASFALPLIIAGGLSYSNLTHSNGALVKDAGVSVEQYITKSSQSNSPVDQALVALSNENYTEALRILDKADISSAMRNDALDLEAYALIKTNQAKEAIAKYAELMGNQTGPAAEKTEFYLATAYVKNDQKNQAMEILNNIISNPDHDYFKEASLMQKKLTSLWRKLVF